MTTLRPPCHRAPRPAPCRLPRLSLPSPSPADMPCLPPAALAIPPQCDYPGLLLVQPNPVPTALSMPALAVPTQSDFPGLAIAALLRSLPSRLPSPCPGPPILPTAQVSPASALPASGRPDPVPTAQLTPGLPRFSPLLPARHAHPTQLTSALPPRRQASRALPIASPTHPDFPYLPVASQSAPTSRATPRPPPARSALHCPTLARPPMPSPPHATLAAPTSRPRTFRPLTSDRPAPDCTAHRTPCPPQSDHPGQLHPLPRRPGSIPRPTPQGDLT